MAVMNNEKTTRQLGRVADALVEGLMDLTDEDLLAEVREDGEDPESLARQAAEAISSATLRTGKTKMALAKAAYEAMNKQRSATVLKFSLIQKRQIINGFIANDYNITKKMTVAARNGDALSEHEIDSFINDLLELGAIDDEGRPI
jgi:hypothetical protein